MLDSVYSYHVMVKSVSCCCKLGFLQQLVFTVEFDFLIPSQIFIQYQSSGWGDNTLDSPHLLLNYLRHDPDDMLACPSEAEGGRLIEIFL